MNKLTTSVLHLCIFICIANFPFISVTQLAGMDVFLDSFENTEHYLYLHDDGGLKSIDITTDEYIILQKSTHPSFQLKENDVVLYYDENGNAACQHLSHITATGPLLTYHLASYGIIESDHVIYDNQIIGKVVSTVKHTMWNAFCLHLWDIAISQLNIRTLL